MPSTVRRAYDPPAHAGDRVDGRQDQARRRADASAAGPTAGSSRPPSARRGRASRRGCRARPRTSRASATSSSRRRTRRGRCPSRTLSRRSDVPRQRFMTNPSGLRHSSRQRSRSGLNCHRPATSRVVPMITWVWLGQPRRRRRRRRGCRDRASTRRARTRPRRRGSRRAAGATSRPGRRRRPTRAPNVRTSGMLDGSIIATIIRTQPTTKSATSSGSGPTPPSWWR